MAITPARVDKWVRARFRERYCDMNGKQNQAVEFNKLERTLQRECPDYAALIPASIARLNKELYKPEIPTKDVQILKTVCTKHPVDKSGRFKDRATVKIVCEQRLPGIHPRRLDELVTKFERESILVRTKQASTSMAPVLRDKTPVANNVNYVLPATLLPHQRSTRSSQQYVKTETPTRVSEPSIPDTITIGGKEFKFERTEVSTPVPAQPAFSFDSSMESTSPSFTFTAGGSASYAPVEPRVQNALSTMAAVGSQGSANGLTKLSSGGIGADDLLSRKLKQIQLCSSRELGAQATAHGPPALSTAHASATSAEANLMDMLMPRDRTQETRESEDEFDVRHAPLVSGDIVDQSSNDLLPQSGFLGTQGSGEMEVSRSKIFVNSNAPFSTFICGVQGSGKSHTTACFLENAILSSPVLGRAGKPLSALVFSYGEYSSVGSGFSVSEVAFLGSPNSAFPKLTPVRKINVLVSATNPGIRRLYERLPNVTVTAFKLKPWLLDIGTILTFMNVHTDKEGPLYMAQFNNVLREIATECDGRFDYRMLKPKLKACRFDFRQMKFLQMRLNLLESFLDLNNAYPDPQYRPGEITIIDMSCPFVDASTACTLFKLGLQRYLQSQAPGKMVVLDEAHKYMLNVPGAKALNESLLTTIRLQRHYGTRVIVSTQEPTLLTSLIALCSVVIVHRFTSPEWFAALKKHIIIPQEDEKDVIRAIEQLRTGTALVYSSNAVLGRNGDGTLDKGAGRLVVMKMRKRITFDGGQSILCE